ncbi:MAG: RpiB/LacA/LacB family sugar-phosphate isomerase [Spirochaetaceae bacterium]|nr:RpiB/LacA/LacB family sugar-phosphate isomerase [Spirochaetaceae bacterium]
MIVAIGSDPNAVELKNELIDELKECGHKVVDFGSDDPVYAKVAIAVAESVVRGECERGIVVCGTGIGVSVAANKVPGARCALVTDHYQAERAALSNDANLIAMGQLVTGVAVARGMLRVWMTNTGCFDPQGRSGPKVSHILEYENIYDSQ